MHHFAGGDAKRSFARDRSPEVMRHLQVHLPLPLSVSPKGARKGWLKVNAFGDQAHVTPLGTRAIAIARVPKGVTCKKSCKPPQCKALQSHYKSSCTNSTCNCTSCTCKSKIYKCYPSPCPEGMATKEDLHVNPGTCPLHRRWAKQNFAKTSTYKSKHCKSEMTAIQIEASEACFYLYGQQVQIQSKAVRKAQANKSPIWSLCPCLQIEDLYTFGEEGVQIEALHHLRWSITSPEAMQSEALHVMHQAKGWSIMASALRTRWCKKLCIWSMPTPSSLCFFFNS